jgi:hypothetical protein
MEKRGRKCKLYGQKRIPIQVRILYLYNCNNYIEWTLPNTTKIILLTTTFMGMDYERRVYFLFRLRVRIIPPPNAILSNTPLSCNLFASALILPMISLSKGSCS